jgi:hypothetical protein
MGEGDPRRPLFSSLADDAGLAEAVDAFVVGLAERIDLLLATEAAGNLGALAALGRALASDARRLGYESLADVAGAVGGACDARDPREARKQLVELTELCQRVRLGHRGAL